MPIGDDKKRASHGMTLKEIMQRRGTYTELDGQPIFGKQIACKYCKQLSEPSYTTDGTPYYGLPVCCIDMCRERMDGLKREITKIELRIRELDERWDLSLAKRMAEAPPEKLNDVLTSVRPDLNYRNDDLRVIAEMKTEIKTISDAINALLSKKPKEATP